MSFQIITNDEMCMNCEHRKLKNVNLYSGNLIVETEILCEHELACKRVNRIMTKWIPCEERLPDIEEHYTSKPCIVYCENGAYGFAELKQNIFGQVGWNCERDDEYHEPLGKVMAWMPLPEPYEGESNE